MKIFLKTLLCFIFVFTLFVPFSETNVSANSGNTDIVIIEKDSKPGETVTVKITFNSDKEFLAASGSLNYTPSVFEFISGENANLSKNGTVKFVSGVSGEKCVSFLLKFKVLKAGNVYLSLDNCFVSDVNDETELTGNSVIYSFNQEEGKPGEKLRGDINGDNAVNAVDLALLKKKIAGLISHSDTSVKYPDINEDGIVNATDLALLKKIISNLI